MQKFGIRLLVTGLLGLLASLNTTQAGEAIEGSAKADKLDACVAPTPFMRRNHFELIKHQRIATVRQGIRAPDQNHSLAGCVDCHVRKDGQGEFIPVTAEKQFCSDCHSQVAVSLDCFSCHATRPKEK